jgi:hypothetical protein
VFRFDDAFNAP